MGLKDAIDRFLEYCELDKNLSVRTIRMYSYYRNFFMSWLISNKGLKESNAQKILEQKRFQALTEMSENLEDLSKNMQVQTSQGAKNNILATSNSVEDFTETATSKMLDSIFGEGSFLEKAMDEKWKTILEKVD